MKVLQILALALTIIGAVNWGFVGLFDFDLVASLFGTSTTANIVYTIIGIAGLINIGLLLHLFNEDER